MSAFNLLAATLTATLLASVVPGTAAAAESIITLPKPDTSGGKPLMQALADRQSGREYSAQALPLPVLANLLWAAAGVNRPQSGKRTAPSAKGWAEIDVYVASADGLYIYDGKAHVLKLVVAKDLRALTGRQDFVGHAPVNLVYVADYERMDAESSDADKQLYAATDTGFIAQNVYLYCASQGLATVVRGWIDREALGRAMQLKPSQHIQLAQTVGYPPK
jgi:SagB-type dehydrogenase family enzyme